MATRPKALTRSRVDELNSRSWDLSGNDARAALRLAEEAASVARDADYQRGLAQAELNAGWALLNCGEYDAAVGRFYQARLAFEQQGEREGVMMSLNALGALSARVGESDQADAYFTESLTLARANGNRMREVAALNNIGELRSAGGAYDEALRWYREGEQIADELEEPGILAIVHANLGRLFVDTGDAQRAVPHLERAVDLASSVGDLITGAEAMTSLGRARGALAAGQGAGPADEAQRLHLRSIELCERAGHPAGLILALQNLGMLCLDLGRLDEAERHLKRAMEVGLRHRMQLEPMAPYEELARRFEEAGDLAGALRVERRLLSVQRETHELNTARTLQALRAQHELGRNADLRVKSEELERSNEKLQLLNRVGSELTSSLELDELGRRLHDRLNELMDAPVFGIAIHDAEQGTVDYAVMIEDGQRIAPFSVRVDDPNTFSGWVVRNRREIWMNDASRQARKYVRERRPFTQRRAHSMIFQPLELGSRVIGVLTVQSFARRAYSEDDLSTLRLLSRFIAVAMDNSRKVMTIQRLNEELQRDKKELEEAYKRIVHMANHDLLTGLPNRRLFEELVTEYIPLARRQGRGFALVYLDLDQFKAINDGHGHAVGDGVLVRVADRLRKALRESDTVARIGGDEFVLIVREVGDENAVTTIAEKVRCAVEQPIEADGVTCRTAASIGISIYPGHGANYDELLVAADRAMYQAKQSGGSRIAVADSVPGDSEMSRSEVTIESPSKRNLP